MDDPEFCSVCHQQLRRVWHPAAHGHHYYQQAEIRTCPHNILTENHFAEPRHDEWHHCENGWVKREN
jgi:hypothetical protein